MRSIITFGFVALTLLVTADIAVGLEPGLPPDMTAGTTITFQGPKGQSNWVLESREDGLFHWRSGEHRWVKRTNFGPTLEWSNAKQSGSNEFDGSHAELYPLEQGKSSKIEFTTSNGKYYHQTCTVLAVETITVPMGMFATYPVDCKYVFMKTGKVRKRRVYYYSPQHRFFIRRKAGRDEYNVVNIKP